MFQNLKSRNNFEAEYKNSLPHTHPFSRAPGTSSSVTKVNEGDRLVRCQICGFPCDRERDVRIKDNTFAGLGVQLGTAQTAGSSVGDSKAPAAGSVTSTPDTYYNRTVSGGCPCCGSYLYDPAYPIREIPPLR